MTLTAQAHIGQMLDLSFWDTVPDMAALARLGIENGTNFSMPFERITEQMTLRRVFVEQLSFAIPCREVLDAIAARSRSIVEVGAGTGFWAKTIKGNTDVDIIATNRGGSHGYKHENGRLFPVEPLSADDAVCQYPDRDVLMIWPSYTEGWAYRAANAMQPGRTLFYIGEDHGGCCANDAFFELLDESFEFLAHVPMPQFMGIHDELFIYRKR